MGKNFFVSGDKSIDFDDRAWITTAIAFNTIFDRVKNFFKPHELMCKEKCYEDTGIDGIDLDYASKDCFNIFYIRCREALAHYPDKEILLWLEKFPNEPEKNAAYIDGIIGYWKHDVLKRLELDKRYDAVWIASYQRKLGEIS